MARGISLNESETMENKNRNEKTANIKKNPTTHEQMEGVKNVWASSFCYV